MSAVVIDEVLPLGHNGRVHSHFKPSAESWALEKEDRIDEIRYSQPVPYFHNVSWRFLTR